MKAINNVTEGVSAVGQTAADAGFTFEQLAAMIGKVSEKTRDSGSEIGNSLKTMLTMKQFQKQQNLYMKLV